jgi:hypothetical protein
MPSVRVVIPYKYDQHRELALRFVMRKYARLNLPISIAEVSRQRIWCKADALKKTIDNLTEDVLIIADADCVVDNGALLECISKVMDTGVYKWAIPHGKVHRLDEMSSRHYMVFENLEGCTLEELPYLGVETGGVFVIHREVYLDCPFDRRFKGWGGEDHSLGYALTVLHGGAYREIAKPLIHLWHPSQSRENRKVGSQMNESLRREYVKAGSDPAYMRKLVEDGKSS